MKPHPALLLACFVLASQPLRAAVERAEVVVYEGTPGGVMAAVEAARHGYRVALINVSQHVGGVISGGLTNTDIGNRATMGGLAQEFIESTVNYYRDKYGAKSPQYLACKNGRKFEPHVAELTFEKMLKAQPGITVWKGHRYRSVTLEGGRITALVVDDLAAKSSRTFTGEVFIDASYEGDLMAGAKVPYRVGREGAEEFGETLAGISIGPDKDRADKRLMAYNYRVSITKRLGEKILDPAAGTGGFLSAAIDFIRDKEVRTLDDEAILQKSITGWKLKPVSYVLGLTNLILHGIDVPDWHYLDSLKTEYNSIGPKQQVEVILANPPFGASIADGVETNFPQSTFHPATVSTNLLFFQAVLKEAFAPAAS